MIVPDNVRKCVAFLGIRKADGKFQLAGSVFWIGQEKPGEGKADPVYAVTARHVTDKIRSMGVQHAWLRLNHRGGSLVWLKSDLDQWYAHPSNPSLDVAILKMGLADDWDHLVLGYSLCITDEVMKENEVGLGDEVFITGLFRHHHGSRRNIPIVRVGNIACMGEEQVVTRLGPMDAMLVEARSIGGLSGSPVFLNLGVSRMIDRQLKQAKQGKPIFYLVGLIHGHYDMQSVERVNTGIAIVVPFHSIRTVIDAYEQSE